MTISETYAFLESIRRMEAEIIKLTIRRDELETCLLPAGIRYDTDRVQTTPSDRFSEIAGEVLDLERQIRELNFQKAAQITAVNDAVSLLESDVEQIILLGFYVGKIPAPRLAEIVHYSIRGVYKVRRRAVQHLSQVCTKCTTNL